MPCPFPCQGKLNMGFGDRPNLELLRALGELQQRCAILKEENQMLVRFGKRILGPGWSWGKADSHSLALCLSVLLIPCVSMWEPHGGDMIPEPERVKPSLKMPRTPL